MKKKLLSFLLAAAMLLTTQGIPAMADSVTGGNEMDETGEAAPANPVHHCTGKYGGSDCTDWSYVYFGSYPQTQINSDEVTDSMREAYYDSNGDAWVDGVKYRRMGPYSGDFYWYYKWERIKWRVLQNDGSTLLVMADMGLDGKKYNETEEPVTWESCSLRAWLNDTFYNTAFSSSEQEIIETHALVNDDNQKYGTEGGNNTQDNIYLLSEDEVENPLYGFCEDYKTYSASRWAQTSDYASHMGASGSRYNPYTGGNYNCFWWLRSPGMSTAHAASVSYGGNISRDGSKAGHSKTAVLPVLRINLASDLWYTFDDGTSGEGGNLKSDPESPLPALKRRLKKELKNYKNPEDYREAQKEKLAEALAAGKEAIDAAEDEAGVEAAFASAKAAMDKIRTNAQLISEEMEVPKGLRYADREDGNGIIITGYYGNAEEVEIPESIGGRKVTAIGDRVFLFDVRFKLSRVIVPDSVTSIGDYGISGNYRLGIYYRGSQEQWEAIDIGDGVIDSGVWIYYNYTDDECYINKDYSYYIMEDGTVCVSDYNGDSTDIEVPETFACRPVSTIAYQAFKERSDLTSVSLPSSVTSIEESAFAGCSGLTSVTLPSGLKHIEQNAFRNCTGLTSVSLSSGIENMGSYVFAGCSSLTEISLPSGLAVIGDYAFANCTGLTEISFPSNFTQTGKGVFAGCSGLTSVRLPSGLTKIGEFAFSGCIGLSEIDLSGITTISYGAFRDCSNLSKINLINTGGIYLGDWAFANCSSLPDIDFSHVTGIRRYAFANCTGITNLNIPSNIGCIDIAVFAGCSNLKSVSWAPKGEYFISDSAFEGCTSLTNVSITNDSHPTSTVLRPGSIGADAFKGCKSLMGIRLPGIRRIMANAFNGCTSLASVDFSEDLNEIGMAAFENCSSLKNVYYAGTQDQWKHVKIDMAGNQSIWSATMHYGTMGPAGTGSGSKSTGGTGAGVSADKPSATSLSGKVKAKSKGFVVKWKKKKSVSGYQIQYSTSKKFTKKTTRMKTVKKASATSLTIKKLKAKKTYYVRIRTYKTVNGKKIVSDWSKVKSVKTKK